MLLKSSLATRGTQKTLVVKCNASKNNSNLQAKWNSFLDKKRELDRTRWEKLKEISRTFDHIVKNDIKQTYDLLKEIHPKVPQTDNTKEPELKSVDLADEETS